MRAKTGARSGREGRERRWEGGKKVERGARTCEGDAEDTRIVALGNAHVESELIQPLHLNLINVAFHAHEVLHIILDERSS